MSHHAHSLWILVTLSACQATGGDPTFWEPAPVPVPNDDGGGEGGSEPGVGGGLATGTVTLDVVTVSYGGEFGPRHVSAFWVEDAEGQFIKTLEVRAAKRIEYLTAWREASGDDVVDAITGATQQVHGPRSVTWNLRDREGALVPDGTYRILGELSEHNGSGPWVATPFDKGAAPSEATPADVPGFSERHLVYEP